MSHRGKRVTLACVTGHSGRQVYGIAGERGSHLATTESITGLVGAAQPTTSPWLAGRFQARFERCAAAFQVACIGPARASQAARLQRAQAREHSRFLHDYNDRLFNGMLRASLWCWPAA